MEIQFDKIGGSRTSTWDNFELLCNILIEREFPLARAIEGKGGDEGIDSIIGQISNAERIFQSKFFVETLTASQRSQINKSLNTAILKQNPKHWTLCIAKDLTPSEEKWFETLKAKHPASTIDYWNATTLTGKLLNNPDVRYEFFSSEDSIGGFDLLSHSFLSQFQDIENDPSTFYNGSRPTWLDIISDNDIRRELTDIVLIELLKENKGIYLQEFTASGGSGKTTFLMRLGFDLLRQKQIVLFHRRDSKELESESIIRFASSLKDRRIFLLIDDISRLTNYSEFVEYLCGFSLKITLVAASRSFERKTISSPLGANYEIILNPLSEHSRLDTLTDKEIALLIDKLSTLEKVKKPSPDNLESTIKLYAEESKRSVLAFVLIATKAEGIADIVREEAERLRRISPNLHNIYRYICLLNTMGAFATRRILEKLLGNPSNLFGSISQMSGLIDETGKQIFARHDRIAEIALEAMFQGEEENLLKLTEKIIKAAIELEEWTIIEQLQPILPVSPEALNKLVVLQFEAKALISDFSIALNFLYDLCWNDHKFESALEKIISSNFLPLLNYALKARKYSATFIEGDTIQTINTNTSFLVTRNEYEQNSNEDFYENIDRCSFIFLTLDDHIANTPPVAFGSVFFELLCALFPNEAKLHFESGNYYMSIRKEAEAVEHLQKAITIDSEYLVAYVFLTAAAYLAYLPEIATNAFDKAFSLNPENIISMETDLIIDYLLEFLQLSGRIEDWLFVSALQLNRSIETLELSHAYFSEKLATDLRLESHARYEEIMSGSQMPTSQRAIELKALSVWLREQPIDVKRECAAGIWNKKPHTLPGDTPNFRYND